jgi:hypothetical protein
MMIICHLSIVFSVQRWVALCSADVRNRRGIIVHREYQNGRPSHRRNWVPPHPIPAGECAPPIILFGQ